MTKAKYARRIEILYFVRCREQRVDLDVYYALSVRFRMTVNHKKETKTNEVHINFQREKKMIFEALICVKVVVA